MILEYSTLDGNGDAILSKDFGTSNVTMSMASAKEVLFEHSGWLSLNLALVYMMEYSCIVCWADRANPKTDNQGFLRDNVNINLNLGLCHFRV